MTRARARQRGMSLMVAIFLVAVIASLAAFAVTIGSASGDSRNLQLQADRVLAAARAGSEWGLYRARMQTLCAGPTNLPLSQGALRGFRVTVTCTMRQHDEGGGVFVTIYDIDSFAQWGNFGAAGYASRRVVSRISSVP